MASRPDTTLQWCIERLSTAAEVPHDALCELIGRINTATRGSFSFPPLLDARLLLSGLLHTDTITMDTFNSLNHLGITVQNARFDLDEGMVPHLLPPAELMLQVKTELVAQTWRHHLATPADIVANVQSLFGNEIQEYEVNRYNELMRAASEPTYRISIDRNSNEAILLEGLRRFARNAQEACGPTLLETISDDINAGKYIPGALVPVPAPTPRAMGMGPTYLPPSRLGQPPLSAGGGGGYRPVAPRQTPPALNAPRPAPAPLPLPVPEPDDNNHGYEGGDNGDGGYPSPPQLNGGQKRRRVDEAGPSAAPGLGQARRNLQAAGGVDPLPRLLAQATAAGAGAPTPAMAAAAAAAVLAAAFNSPDGLGARPTMPRFESAPPPELGRLADVQVHGGRSPTVRNSGHRRQNRKWSDEETAALLSAIREHGLTWSFIQTEFGHLLGDRTQVDLKDKWRNLCKFNNPEALVIRQILDEKEAVLHAEIEAKKAALEVARQQREVARQEREAAQEAARQEKEAERLAREEDDDDDDDDDEGPGDTQLQQEGDEAEEGDEGEGGAGSSEPEEESEESLDDEAVPRRRSQRNVRAAPAAKGKKKGKAPARKKKK